MERALRVMIVDDEPLAVRRLVRLIRDEDDIDIVAVAENGRQALEVIGSARPDILLLDVEMPGVNGFDLLSHLPDGASPAVIFVTAFDSYAVKAFEARALDFVMKPVAAERLHAALEQARHDIKSRDAGRKLAALQQLLAQMEERKSSPEGCGFDSEIWVQQRSEMVRVPVSDIEWIEAEKDYVRIHTAARTYMLHGLIGAFEARLDPADFMRVHRSAIVRLASIKSVKRGAYSVMDLSLTSGQSVRVGRKYSGAVRSFFGRHDRLRPGDEFQPKVAVSV